MISDCFIIFFEILALMMLTNCAMGLGRQESFTPLTWACVCMSTAYVEILNILFPAYSVLTIFAHGFTFIYCFIKKRNISIALYATACGIVLMTIIEMVLSLPDMFLHMYIVYDDRIILLIKNIVALIVVYGCAKFCGLQALFEKLYRVFQRKNYMIALFICIFLSFSFEVKMSKVFGLVDFLIFVVYFLTIFGISYLLYQENIKNIKQKYENEQLGIYSQAYDTILKKVRARQHEFNNHLNTIANMHVLYNDYDTLVKHQAKYVGELKESYKYNKLLNSRQTVISGFLYMKFVEYEDAKVDVDYTVEVMHIEDYIPIIELIEILGVLIDNAFQELRKLGSGIARKMKVEILEIDGELSILVANTLEKEIKYKDMMHFTEEGYSTKGSGHGIGLFNLKNIVKKHKGGLAMRSNFEEDNYWIVITCKLKKEQELLKG